MNELRRKWSLEFRKVLPGKLASRAMQIDATFAAYPAGDLLADPVVQ
jgi:hypothetical protein